LDVSDRFKGGLREMFDKQKGNSVMLFGIGEVGASVLHLLARQEGVSEIIACDKREDIGVLITERIATSAGIQGYSKKIKFERCDVYDIDATAELINKYKPDIVYSSLVLFSWRWSAFLPGDLPAQAEKIWSTLLPGQIVLIYKLMQAVRKSGCNPICIQNSMPDVVNPILHKCGLAVLTGAGNCDSVATLVKRGISVKEDVPIDDVKVFLIMEHCLGGMGTKGKNIPYFIKVMIGDKDITKKYDLDSMINEYSLNRHGGPSIMPVTILTAGSAVHLIAAILNDTNEFFHTPGPNGLIGGYPVRVSRKGVKIELPQEVTMEEAIKINTEAAKYEGFEKIKDDGTIVITDEAYQTTKKILGYECREIRPEDFEYWAKLLITKIKKLGTKYGFSIPI